MILQLNARAEISKEGEKGGGGGGGGGGFK